MRFAAPKKEEGSKKRGMKRRMKNQKNTPVLGTIEVLCIESYPL
jgi:hypothetical protein